MTQITIEPRRIVMTGHAGADRNANGNDLVCCAVSTLACALKLQMMNADAEQKLISMSVDEDSGNVAIGYEPKPEYGAEMDIKYGVITDALIQLAEENKEYIKIIRKGGKG